MLILTCFRRDDRRPIIQDEQVITMSERIETRWLMECDFEYVLDGN